MNSPYLFLMLLSWEYDSKQNNRSSNILTKMPSQDSNRTSNIREHSQDSNCTIDNILNELLHIHLAFTFRPYCSECGRLFCTKRLEVSTTNETTPFEWEGKDLRHAIVARCPYWTI
ncbi:hypothetical protein BC829DRAFT_143929 [Chytridium lagenaria]|nr:hypothetical protein BC829DRAFT_143929 [Chytridium lagenaria]